MLSRYKMLYRQKLPDGAPETAPGAVRKDTRKHTQHILRPTAELVEAYQAGHLLWNDFAKQYQAVLAARHKAHEKDFDALANLATRRDVYLGCSCPTLKNPDINQCHTVLALEFMEQHYPQLEVRYPDEIAKKRQVGHKRSSSSSKVYHQLRKYQGSNAVPLHELRKELNRMAGVFIDYFTLGIDEFVIGVGSIRGHALGQYRPNRNALGLRAEIIISEDHVREAVAIGEEWDVFGTLLHELDHAWQELHGKPSRGNYHNLEFRRKAAEQGLLIDAKGYQQYDPGSPFFLLLEQEGKPFPAIPEPKRFDGKKKEGRSTLTKWYCDCDPPQIARVGKEQFEAFCMRCNTRFRKAGILF